ncbi:hypothetical protein [Shewanella sp.]|uniref:hypothetical protein n=1 Tax=Shewanella sp. TaxID=50422 RepID=UPI003A85DD27
MKSCYIIEEWQLFNINSNCTSFKSQKIFNQKQQVVAEEILFNMGQKSADEVLKSYKLFFSHPLYIDNLINATKNRAVEANLSRVFINIEHQTLCDQWSLAKFIELKKLLETFQCKLVIEITERMNCGCCDRLTEGLQRLKEAGILLALDDYNMNNEEQPFPLGIFDIIKIIKPQKSNINAVKEHLNSTKAIKNKEIIIENIETKEEIIYFTGNKIVPSKIFYQGYYLHKPEIIKHI